MTRGPGSWRALAGGVAMAAGAAAYAVVCHLAASTPSPGLLEALVFIVPLMAFAVTLAWRSAHRAAWLATWIGGCAVLVLLRDRLGASTTWVLLAQHVAMNAMFWLVFTRTLLPGAVPLVTRLALLVHGGVLSPLLVRYTRAVTWVWAGYFALSASLSVLLFLVAPVPLWSAFVNLVSMPAIVALFVGEYLVRLAVIPRAERSGFAEAIHAYRRYADAQRGSPPPNA